MRKRDLILLIAALCAAVALAVRVMAGGVQETGNWGLSFRGEGTPPIGPASAEQLKKYNAAYLGDSQEKVIYLTFDAGYENGCTAPGGSFFSLAASALRNSCVSSFQ